MVQIITDSSTLYTREEAKAAGFEAVPLCVTIGDMEGRDCHIDMDAFYGKISEGLHPSSSQPPIGEVVDVYEDNITVINSKTLCGPHRYMVEKAQAMKEAGCSAKEIIDWVNAATEKHESFLIPQDFDFLRRGGRLTPVAAAFGSMLRLKPIMTQTPGGKRLDKFSVKRTMKAAIQEVISHMQKKGVDDRYIVYVSHARALKDAMNAKEAVEKAFEGIEVRLLELGAAFVTQGGPQCIAIQYIEK